MILIELYALAYNSVSIIFTYTFKHIMEELAEFVKSRRKEVNLNQEEFAERAGVGPQMETLEARISTLTKKRMNGMIAIMKDIEKSQTKPTVSMLYSLFENVEPPKKKTLMLEKKSLEKNEEVK